MKSTRHRILDVARALYREGGEAAISMRRVAGRVGVTATAIYRHYDSKEALLAEVRGEGLDQLDQYLRDALAAETPDERLERAGWAYLEFALERPADYRRIFMEPRRIEAQGSESADAELAVTHSSRGMTSALHVATHDFLLDRVEECIDAGTIKDDLPRDLVLTLWAQIHGLIALYLSGAVEGDADRFRRRYARSLGQLFAGIGV